MNKKLSEKLFFSLFMTDFDYISSRHLMAASLFPSAASLANTAIDRYIKTYLWAISRDDLVDKIRKWGGNESHNVPRMIRLYEKEIGEPVGLDEVEMTKLANIHKSYCFRYVDTFFEKDDHTQVQDNYMHVIDKVCFFFRSKIELIPPHAGNTIIDILRSDDQRKIRAFNTGNADLRVVLFNANRYFKIDN